jgi:type II secretory pathway pseudopilin PulG
MDTALIIVIAVVAILLVAFLARRAWARGLEARREKAGELRVEAAQRQESARRAEIEAEREREEAEARGRRAERLDPDTDTPGGRFGILSRNRDEDIDEDERGYDEAEASDGRRSLWDRLARR